MRDRGFTLIEILVSISILAIVMTILYGTFSTSSANARIIEERADELSSLTGAVDILGREVRCVYYNPGLSPEGFTGRKEIILFNALTPFVKGDEAMVSKVSYLFDEEKLTRKTFRTGHEAETESESILLKGVKDASFSFYDGKEWITEWPPERTLPYGIKLHFSYKGRDVETVIPVLARN